MRRKFLIVVNPTAGVPRQRFLDAVVCRLAVAGATADIIREQEAWSATQVIRARLGDCDAVVAAGGDGTARQVAAAIGAARVPMGIIPLGTGNVLAREIGLRMRPADVAETLLTGDVATVHGALANGSPFYLMAGIGFDARVVAGLPYGLKRKAGRAAYAPAVIGAWRAAADDFEVEVDGACHRANWVIVANACHYGGSFKLMAGGSIFSPGLTAILIRAPRRRILLGQLLRLALGRMTDVENPHVTVLPVERRVAVTSVIPVAVQLDGDRFGETPVEIDASGPQVGLIVPRTCETLRVPKGESPRLPTAG